MVKCQSGRLALRKSWTGSSQTGLSLYFNKWIFFMEHYSILQKFQLLFLVYMLKNTRTRFRRKNFVLMMFYLYLEFPARWDCANFWTISLTNSKACPRNYNITEIILPNVICVHCHILLAKFDNGDSVKLPTFFDFSSLQHSVLLNHAVVKSAKMLSLTL